MPVRFLCDNCRGLLSVGRKKIGAEIECPKCGAAMIVPEMEAAAASLARLARAQSTGAPKPSPGDEADPFSEFVVFDEPDAQPPDSPGGEPAAGHPAANGNGTPPPVLPENPSTRQAGPGAGAAARSPDSEQADPQRPRVPSRPRRSDRQRQATPPSQSGLSRGATTSRPAFVRSPGSPMLLVSRRVVYVQAVLFCIVAAAAFVSGWLIGRGMPPAAAPDPETTAAVETVLIQGTISYVSREGEPRTDGGAVLIALPEGRLPDSKLPVRRLGPLEAAPEATSATLLAIEELGGRYVRAGADGHYSLVVPRPGRYRLLIISRHTMRLGGTPVAETDLEALGAYFRSPTALIGQQKYALLSEDVPAGLYDKSHNFGVSGEL